MDWLSVEEAAERLQVGPSQVRRLAREGQLPARRVGNVWLIDSAGVAQRQGLSPSAGRPLSAQTAWVVIRAIDTALLPHQPDDIQSPLADRRERYRLRHLLSGAPRPPTWDAWLRRRATPQPMWFHPGTRERLAADRRVRAGGAYAVVAAGLGLSGGSELPSLFYVDAERVNGVVAKYRGRYDPNGPVTLMVIPSEVPSDLRPPPGGPTPPAAALVDLLGSPNARERHLAVERLGRVAAEFHALAPP